MQDCYKTNKIFNSVIHISEALLLGSNIKYFIQFKNNFQSNFVHHLVLCVSNMKYLHEYVVFFHEMANSVKVSVFFVVFNLFLYCCSSKTPISETTKNFIQQVLENFARALTEFNGNSRLLHGVIISRPTSTSSINPDEFLADDLIIWDPLSVFETLTLWCPSCLECGVANQPLTATRWKDASTTCDEPRRLYGLTSNVLLVSRVYVCAKRHQIIAHDPAILSQVKDTATINLPFLLFHKAGITKDLNRFIISHANAGLSISDIQTLWLQTLYDSYGSRRQAFFAANSNAACSISFPEFEQRFQHPGEKVITSCIARNYFQKEHLYIERMCQHTSDKWLSCDHTFRVSANIGFWFNNRWVKLYDTLFIVLNEEGVVLSWKLCRGTKFSSVENVLQLLKERLDQQGKQPATFFLDNCCSWRAKLTKIFPDIAIKLDVFHAIQRVIKKVPRKKGCSEIMRQLRRKMICSLCYVIRDPADVGKQRTMPTPLPEVILNNFNMFESQWGKVEVDSIPLLTSSAIKEIEKLKVHVRKGCLSGIPPSGGTNRNEALHKTLNKTVRRSRIGLELALAFLGLFFYKWNERIMSKLNNNGRRVSFVRPVESYANETCDNLSQCREQFGGSLSVQESVEASECDLSDPFSDNSEVIKCISYLLEEHSDNVLNDDSCSSDDEEESGNEEDSAQIFTVDTPAIIQQASNLCSLKKHLDNIKSEDSFSTCFDLVNLKNALSLLSFKNTPYTRKQRNIDDLLNLNNMQRINVLGDGNCFFVSLATMIQQQLQDGSLSAEAIAHMENLGIIGTTQTNNIGHMASVLRCVLVEEWLSNPTDYQPFLLSGQDYNTEVNAFLQDGHFASELGNSMPLAASNKLQIPLVVFTEMLNFPILPICPRDRVISDNPLYLAYDMGFAGHYDAIKQQKQSPATEIQQGKQFERAQILTADNAKLSCRCGQGAKKKKKGSISCHDYKNGCKCFQNVSGCNVNCQCINCENPRGKKVTGTVSIACSSRKRRHHEYSTERLSGKAYTQMKAGGTMTVHWTLFEELVLMEIMLALVATDKLDPIALYEEYNHMVDVIEPTTMKHCLSKKSERHVALKLSTFLSNQKVFETVIKEQVQINFSK